MNVQTNGRTASQDVQSNNPGRIEDRDTAQPRKTNKWVVGGVLVLLVIGAVAAIVKRPSSPTATTTPAVTAETLELTDPIGSAIREAQDIGEGFTGKRANHILGVAQAAAKRNGTSTDQELNQLLRQQIQKIHKIQAEGALTGNAKDKTKTDTVVGDTKAIVQAMSGNAPKEDEPISLSRLTGLLERIERKTARPQQQ